MDSAPLPLEKFLLTKNTWCMAAQMQNLLTGIKRFAFYVARTFCFVSHWYHMVLRVKRDEEARRIVLEPPWVAHTTGHTRAIQILCI
jgi:hypothetical protein